MAVSATLPETSKTQVPLSEESPSKKIPAKISDVAANTLQSQSISKSPSELATETAISHRRTCSLTFDEMKLALSIEALFESLNSPKEVSISAQKPATLTITQQKAILPLLIKKLSDDKVFVLHKFNISLRQFISLNLLKAFVKIKNLRRKDFIEPKHFKEFIQASLGQNDYWSDNDKLLALFKKICEGFDIKIAAFPQQQVIFGFLRKISLEVIPLMKLIDLYDQPISETPETITVDNYIFLSTYFLHFLNLLYPFCLAGSSREKERKALNELLKDQNEAFDLLYRKSIENIDLLGHYIEINMGKLGQILERIKKSSNGSIWEISLLIIKLESFNKVVQKSFARMCQIKNDYISEIYASKKIPFEPIKKELAKDSEESYRYYQTFFKSIVARDFICGLMLPTLKSCFQKIASNDTFLDSIDIELPDFEIVNETPQKSIVTAKISKKKLRKQKVKEKSHALVTAPKGSASSPVKASPRVIPLKETNSDVIARFNRELNLTYQCSKNFFKDSKFNRKFLALRNQLLANNNVAWIRGILELDILSSAERETLASFTLLWSYLANEQAFSAAYVHAFPNEILVHRLSFLMEQLKLPADSPWIKERSLDRYTITFRYGCAAGIQRSVPDDLNQLERRIFDSMSLQLVLFRNPNFKIEASNRHSLEQSLKEFDLEKDLAKPAEKAEASKERESLQAFVKEFSNILATIESNLKLDSEATEFEKQSVNVLNDTCFHLRNFSNLLGLIPRICMEPKFAYACMHMTALSLQYLIENMGQYLALINGDTAQTLWQMNADLHDLNFYCEFYDLSKPLDTEQMRLLKDLNIGNKGTYPDSYFARTAKKDQSPIMIYLSQLYENANGSGVLEVTKIFPICGQWAQLALILTKHHLLSKKFA
jgi:hypothetical protein